MKNLLLLLLLLPTLAFGQATGKDIANFATSGSIGLATATVDVYSRINIVQNTPSITLTVPKPTNLSTKVVEVWIANKGTVPYTLIALPDTAGVVVDTGKFVIIKWIGDKYAVNGDGGSGSGGGVTSVSGTTNRITSTGGATPVIDISSSYVGQSSITTLGTIGTGTWQGTAIADSYISSSSTWNDKQDRSVVVSSNQTAINDGIYSNVANATYTDPSPVEGKGFTVFVRNGSATVGGTAYAVAGTVIRRIFHSGSWSNYPSIPVSATSGVSYNSTSGALSFDLANSNTWTALQSAPSWHATGSGGLGYLRLPFQTTAPTAVSGSMILYADGSNRFSIVRRNNANSADITRTHIYPDASYDWTFPTPASGSSSTLAGLETAQTYTQQNTFTNSSGQRMYSLKIWDLSNTTYKTALNATTNILTIGSSFGSTTVSNLLNTPVLTATSVYSNNHHGSTSGGTMTVGAFDPNGGLNIGTIAGAVSVNNTGTQNTPTLRSCNNNGAGGIGGVVVRTGDHNNATATTISRIDIFTGNILNAATVAKSGDITLDVGTAGAAGTRGGISLFAGQTNVTWNGLQRGMYVGNATAIPSGNPTSGFYMYSNAGNAEFISSGGGITSIGTAGVSMQVAGQGLLIKEGTNATLGTATLVGGTITVSTTKVTANSRIFVTIQSPSGTLGTVYVSARTAGTSFTITSTSALDTSVVAWFIVEPN